MNRNAVLNDLKDEIFNMEYFKKLTSREDSDEVMEFINELKKVLEAKGMMRIPKERGKRKMIFPRNLRKMTVHKRELQKKKREGVQLTKEENESVKKCKKLIADFEDELRLKEIRRGIDGITHKDLKQMWNWIDYRVNGKDRKAMIIRDPESGKYESNPKKVAKLWADHYKDWDGKVMDTVRILDTGKTNLCLNQRIKESVEMKNIGIMELSGMRSNQLLKS